MNRRQYLGAVSSVVGGVAAAGCTGGTSSNEASRESPSGTPTPSGEQQATAHMETAGKALQRAGEEISAQSEKFEESEMNSGGGVDFEPSSIYSYLDKASENLDQAEKHTNSVQQEKINSARDYVSFARKATEFLDVTAEGYTQTSTGFSYFQSERYSDTAERLDTAETTLSDADDLLTIVQDRAEQLNTEALDDISQVEVDSMKTSLTTMDELLPALSALASGIRHLSLGMVDFQKATTQVENKQYAEAETNYAKSVDHFSAGETTFKEQESSAPDSIKTHFIELTCYSGALKEGARHLREASAALVDGKNSRARTESEKAKEALNRCSFDS